MKHTDKQLRVAIARLGGWKQGHSIKWTDEITKDYDWGWTDPAGNPQPGSSPGALLLPDYDSHDALAPVLAGLSRSEQDKFVSELGKVVRVQRFNTTDNEWFQVLVATPRQKCEALVPILEQKGLLK